MKKSVLCLPALALAVILSGAAMADEAVVSKTTLQAMGLGGMEVLSDDAAMAVRGRGSLAFGISYAHTGNIGLQGVGIAGDGAGSLDGFRAQGMYMAMGDHQSEAVYTRSHTVELHVKGEPGTKTTRTWMTGYLSGGSASSSSL